MGEDLDVAVDVDEAQLGAAAGDGEIVVAVEMVGVFAVGAMDPGGPGAGQEACVGDPLAVGRERRGVGAAARIVFRSEGSAEPVPLAAVEQPRL